MRTLEDLPLESLRDVTVLVRVDFNVPLAEGRVLDDTRLTAAMPTLNELRRAGARVALLSHCGRPKGDPDPRFSLRPVAGRLEELLGEPVRFAIDCIGPEARDAIAATPAGGLCLLENLRFHPGEKANDEDFANRLAALGKAYVNDAFGAAHRAHASIVGIGRQLERKAAGRLLVREVEALSRLLKEPERPFAALIGGAKIEGKLDTLENLLPRLDVLLLGGGMANTFLAARGNDLADSLVEKDRVDLARQILDRAEAAETRVVLPEDLVLTDDLDDPGRIENADAGSISAGLKAVDVGPRARQAIARELAEAKTVFWNGPLGVFEKPPFDAGTLAAAEALADSPGFTVIGGGETVAAARQAGVLERIDHVSTGGGASLELLAGKKLPGVEILEEDE